MSDAQPGSPPLPGSSSVGATMPRAPGAAVPRRPRPPKQRGTDLEPDRTQTQLRRRTFTWFGLTGVLGIFTLGTVKFFFPRTLFEPPTTFKIGYPSDYSFGVDSRWQSQYRIWVVRDAEKLFVISAICTHLGCTPDWVSSANKFKCPCHGSGYDSAGVNFEGPAPRPMDRTKVSLAADGQIVVDKLRVFGQDDWNDRESYI